VVIAIRVDGVDRVVKYIAVAIKVLRVIRLPDKRVWGDESAQFRVIVSAAIVVEAALWIKNVACEAAQRIA
jgi:hypothetical protein